MINVDDITKYFSFLEHSESELRAIVFGKGIAETKHTKNIIKTIDFCETWQGKANIYAGINERRPGGTKKEDVIKIRVVALDIDSNHPKDQAATEEEMKACALETEKLINDLMPQFGRPHLKVMSGNGYQLYWKIQPIEINDSNRDIIEKKVKKFISDLQKKYNSNAINIDRVGDLPRILKIPGTLSTKGDNTPDRPHRVATIEEYNEGNSPNLRDYLLLLSTEEPKPTPKPNIAPKATTDERLKQVLEKDQKFKSLYDGGTTGYNSRSEAEMALACKCAYYGFDVGTILSQASIGKWNDASKQYRELTERKAYEEILDRFDWTPKKKTATVEDDDSERFFDDAKISQTRLKFGQNFDDKYAYYGVHLGKKDVETEDGKKTKVTLNYLVTAEGKIHYIANLTCDALNIMFRSISSIDDFKGFSATGIKAAKRLILLSQKLTNLTVVTGGTAKYTPTHTITRAHMEAKSKGNFYLILNRYTEGVYVNDGLIGHDGQDAKQIASTNSPSRITDPDFLYSISNLEQGCVATLDLFDIFQYIKEKIRYYVGLPDDCDYDICALWCMATYIYSVFPAFPYLQVNAIKESGKTRLLNVLSLLSFNSLYTSAQRISPIFRFIDGNGGTLIFDEAEGVALDPEKIQILNAGYSKYGGGVLLTDRMNHNVQELFDTYCPKAFGSIANLPPTVVSRSIRINIEKASTNKYDERIAVSDPDLCILRDLLYIFGLQYALLIRDEFLSLDVPHDGISHRYWELYKPLVTLAYVMDEEFGKKIVTYIVEKVMEERALRLMEDEDAMAMGALVRTIVYDGFYDTNKLLMIIRADLGAQDVIKQDKDLGKTYVAHWDQAYKHITSRWVSDFLRNVRLPRKRADDRNKDTRKGGERGRFFKVSEVWDQAIRMGVCIEPTALGEKGIVLTLTGERIFKVSEENR